jgi:ethanolamine utilization microcompartment shell protein EutL
MNRNTDRLNRFRAVCGALAVLALLVFLNTWQGDMDSQQSLRSVGVLNTNVDRVLTLRRLEATNNAWIEYVALVTAGLGVAGALAAPRVLRPLAQS